MYVQYLQRWCLSWGVGCLFSFHLGCAKNCELLVKWKVNLVVAGTVQVFKAEVIMSLLQSCFIYVCSSFLIIVAVLSHIYIGTESCYFVPLEICRGKEKKEIN